MKVLSNSLSGFCVWRSSARYIIVFVFLLLVSYDPAHAFLSVSEASETELSVWLFPFLFRDRYLLLCVAISLLVFCCDIPFANGVQINSIKYLGRVKWLAGQMIYIYLTDFIVLGSIWLFMIIVCASKITLSADWGSCLDMLASDNPYWGAFAPDIIFGEQAVLFSAKMMIMCFISSAVIESIMLLFNLFLTKECGIIAISGISIIDFYSYSLFDELPDLSWISPVSWMNPAQYTDGQSWKWNIRIVIGVFFIAVSTIISIKKFRKMPINYNDDL